MPQTLTSEILAYHRGRLEPLLELKWAKIATDPFTFFRGTAFLFYRTWPHASFGKLPNVWNCGDAHLENIGSYRGENRVPYFDLNDFDEACLAPIHWDVGRALTSFHLAGEAKLAPQFLEVYLQTLAGGKPSHIQPEVAEGPVAALLAKVQSRKREEFLAERVDGNRLLIRDGHTFALDRAARAEALSYYRAWAKTQSDQAFYRPLDLCGRIAGNGSLGLRRFCVLVRGKKFPHILDMKEAAPPAGEPYLGRQPKWQNQAERVAVIQHMMQYVPVAYLSWTRSKPRAFLLKALQPTDDRININKLDTKDYRSFASDWARLLASAHLRSSSWKGSATLDQLTTFGRTYSTMKQRTLLDAAKMSAKHHTAMFRQFKADFPPKSAQAKA